MNMSEMLSAEREEKRHLRMELQRVETEKLELAQQLRVSRREVERLKDRMFQMKLHGAVDEISTYKPLSKEQLDRINERAKRMRRSGRFK